MSCSLRAVANSPEALYNPVAEKQPKKDFLQCLHGSINRNNKSTKYPFWTNDGQERREKRPSGTARSTGSCVYATEKCQGQEVTRMAARKKGLWTRHLLPSPMTWVQSLGHNERREPASQTSTCVMWRCYPMNNGMSWRGNPVSYARKASTLSWVVG